MTLADLRLAVYSRLAADEASPDYTAIHENNITRWANELTSEVIKAIDPINYQALISIGYSLTFSSGVATLPSDFLLPISVSVGNNNTRVYLFDTPAEFARWNSGNFVYTPRSEKPVGMIANGSIYIKPTSYTSGKLDYIKVHPTLSGTQGTVFNALGDNLLIEMVVQKAMNFLQVMD